ncbi:MAG: gliding motility-associated C-terminal domain-containing protein [Flavobacteriales bacterium]|nr:gliding motility-associated C-terminal domain-containing protein [Flavobacteriales bacterium]
MKMQDNKLREIFQTKLSGHESAVNSAIWETVQNAIPQGAAVGGSTIAAKIVLWKVLAAVIGVVALSTVLIYNLSKNNQPAIAEQPKLEKTIINEHQSQETTGSETEVIPEVSNEIKTHPSMDQSPFGENEADGKVENLALSSEEANLNTGNAVSAPLPLVVVADLWTSTTKNPIITPQEEYKNETISNDFSLVGPADMGLRKMLIPVFTRAHAYKWTIKEDDAFYTEMTASHEFSRTGIFHIRLEIEVAPGSGFTEYNEKEICICAGAEIIVPYDLFSPNSDGFSDIFDPLVESKNIEPLRLLIIDKMNGNQVYEGIKKQALWDGKGNNGQEMPDGIYFYFFSATDFCGHKLVEKTGTMRLQR